MFYLRGSVYVVFGSYVGVGCVVRMECSLRSGAWILHNRQVVSIIQYRTSRKGVGGLKSWGWLNIRIWTYRGLKKWKKCGRMGVTMMDTGKEQEAW